MSQTTLSAAAPPSSISRAGKYLTFYLDAEEYGVEILKVQEIIGRMDITPVPGTPVFIRGVINLRGKIVPVMDLKMKFGNPATTVTDQTCIIVVKTASLLIGILVDRLTEVSNIAEQEIVDTPSFGVDVDMSFLLGVAKTSGTVKLLLNIERVLTTQDIISLQTVDPAADAGGTQSSMKGVRSC